MGSVDDDSSLVERGLLQVPHLSSRIVPHILTNHVKLKLYRMVLPFILLLLLLLLLFFGALVLVLNSMIELSITV